ncbi:MAG: sugar ABC transporter permease [Halanaerobiaceae bacterium]|jgi:ABC-type sugar transport system permease subunit|nr:sugar ABC transporter permease [Halanaerobiaceae bacterium]
MKLNKRFRVTVENRGKIGGYLFTLPFVVGFILFFLYPFVQSIIFSLNKLSLTTEGYELEFVRFDNYYYSIFTNTEFNQAFVETITEMVIDLPLILAFSFFAAILLNQKFKGRALARVIFFLPVIYSAGVVLKMEQNDFVTQLMKESNINFMFSGEALQVLLKQTKFLPDAMITYVLKAVDNIPVIIRSSGIQILVFLAGLQSIPVSVYEAAEVEGASGWESFWLITLPMISPLILTNIVYTVVDKLTRADNELVLLIKDTAFTGRGYGVSTAMATMYFAAIAVILGIIFKVFSRYVFYRE